MTTDARDSFDPDALRARYREGRDRRLRRDGNDQYLEVRGEFASFVDDPYVAGLTRAPLTDEALVVVIGGGFGGLLAGARLRQAGIPVNYPHMLGEQSKHIAYIIRHAIERGARTIEVSEEAEAEWVATVIRLARLGQQFLEDCTPGYYNNEGKPGERSGQNGFYGGGSERAE